MKEDEKQDRTWIPLDKIVPSRWRSGIRNKEKYEQTKENIKEHGLNIDLCVFPVHNDKYEVFAGDHRLRILQELGWKEAPCIIEKISEQKAMERCVSDNLCRAGYDAVELENKIYEMYESGKYKSRAELGRKIGLSGQRVGQLIDAKKTRNELNKLKSKGTFTVSTDVILASKPLTGKMDRVQLLTLVQKKKIYAKDTEKVAKLCQSDKILNRMILYEGIPYNLVIAEFQNKISKEIKKKKTKTIAIDNPQLAKDIYKTVSENINAYLLTLDDVSKKTAVNYLKMVVAAIVETLCHDEVITKEQFKQIRDDILEIYRDNLLDYNGESLDNNIGKWVKEHSVKKS